MNADLMKPMRYVTLALASVLFSASVVSAGPAQFVIVNINAPGEGFNDPTPVTPVGGNSGTTLGQQRLIAFEHAAAIWSARLDSNVPIRIRAQFVPLGTGVLGSAGPRAVFRDFPGAVPGTWYHVALVNKMMGFDVDPSSDDINANFSTNFNFYLGLDNNHGALNDLVTVLLHEFAHGLGFSQFASLTTGALLAGFPDIYNSHLLDNTTDQLWPAMTDAERLASATRFGKVVWTGEKVTANVPTVLSLGSPRIEVLQPSSIAGQLQFGLAAFGPTIANSPVLNENVVAAVDAIEPPPTPGAASGTTTDGCSPLSNAGAVAGKIVLIERGFCGFAVKARNATDAGADAVVIYNNAANANAAPPGMADDGMNGPFVTIPAISIRRADGLNILGATGVFMDITVDVAIRAGADALNRARVYAPSPVVGGSSISHYDTVASRNLLMEPAINADLTHDLEAPNDLTHELLRDIGWYDDADGDLVDDAGDCDTSSDLRPTIIVGGIDTGVPNFLFTTGCTGTDLIEAIAATAGNHGGFVSGVAHLTNDWKQAGIITGQQKGAIQSAAAKSN
jgi:hypothetical protein